MSRRAEFKLGGATRKESTKALGAQSPGTNRLPDAPGKRMISESGNVARTAELRVEITPSNERDALREEALKNSSCRCYYLSFFCVQPQRNLMQDFPANSKKAQATEAPREKLKPVTSAETVRRKRGLGHQFKRTFFSGNARDAGEYMLTDVVVPAIRDMLYDAMQSGIDRLIYGEKSTGRARRPPIMGQGMGHVNYSSMSSQPKTSSTQRSLSRRSRARHDFDDLVIPSRQEAEEVLDQMFEILSHDGEVLVSHLYELTGVRSEHTDMKWGWNNLRGAKAVRLRNGGFLLDLPEPEALH